MVVDMIKKLFKEIVETKQPKLTLLIGPPASGKSTWIKNNRKNEVIISRDNIVEELANKKGLSYADSFNDKELQNEVNKQLQKDIHFNFYNEKNIIVDMTNMSKSSRSKFLNMGKEKNYYCIGIVFEVEKYELYRRSEQRKQETGKEISNEIIDSMLSRYEKPTKEEGFDELIFN